MPSKLELPLKIIKENYGSQCHNFFLSIILTDDKNLSYVYDNYIYLTVKHENDNLIDFFSDGIYTENDSNGIINKIHIKGPVDNLIEHIIKGLEKNCYVVLNINEEFLPGKEAYLDHYFRHDILIFGADKEKRTFLTLGFNNYQGYQTTEYSFDDIENSYYRMQYEWDYEIHYIKVNDNYNCEIDKENIKEKLNNYLLGVNPADIKLNEFLSGKTSNLEYVYTSCIGKYYGINVFDYLSLKLSKASKNFTKLNEADKIGINELRSLNVLKAHIDLIGSIVGNFSEVSDYKTYCSEISGLIYKCKLRLMQYLRTNNKKELKKISKELIYIKNMEKTMLEEVCDAL